MVLRSRVWGIRRGSIEYFFSTRNGRATRQSTTCQPEFSYQVHFCRIVRQMHK